MKVLKGNNSIIINLGNIGTNIQMSSSAKRMARKLTDDMRDVRAVHNTTGIKFESKRMFSRAISLKW